MVSLGCMCERESKNKKIFSEKSVSFHYLYCNGLVVDVRWEKEIHKGMSRTF